MREMTRMPLKASLFLVLFCISGSIGNSDLLLPGRYYRGTEDSSGSSGEDITEGSADGTTVVLLPFPTSTSPTMPPSSSVEVQSSSTTTPVASTPTPTQPTRTPLPPATTQPPTSSEPTVPTVTEPSDKPSDTTKPTVATRPMEPTVETGGNRNS
ncbi:hypothetical protein GBAR_LOCUS5610, partial [Geodia barretti]